MIKIQDSDSLKWISDSYGYESYVTKSQTLAECEFERVKGKLNAKLQVRLTVIDCDFRLSYAYPDCDMDEDLLKIEERSRPKQNIFNWFKRLPLWNRSHTRRMRQYEDVVPTTGVYVVSFIEEPEMEKWIINNFRTWSYKVAESMLRKDGLMEFGTIYL